MRLLPFLGSLADTILPNTHAVGVGGFGAALAGLAVHVAAHAADPTGQGHGIAQITLSTLDQYVATPAIAGGSLAALFGRDPRVPADHAPTDSKPN